MQASFDFQPGLTTQFPRMRDLLCAVVYGSRGGLKAVAADCDVSPSELTRMLNREQSDPRNLDVELFLGIIASTGDTRPVMWQIEKYLRNPEQQRAMAAAQIAQVIPGLIELCHQAGIPIGQAKRR